VMEGTGRHVVRFALTDRALIVANAGRGFGEDEIRAISSLGRSSKDPRKSIGYKGLGFKSVGEITDSPQIFSPPYSFGFDADRAATLVERTVGSMPTGQHLPVYAFPIPQDLADAGDDAGLVKQCLDAGFVTVMRLPLRQDTQRAAVEAHLVDVLGPELLLLLDATDGLELSGTDADFVASRTVDTRDDHDEVTLAVDDATSRWWVFRRRHPITDRRLLGGLGEAWSLVSAVGTTVAIPLDIEGMPDPATGHPVHVYFPAEDSIGTAALMHADFALELDRRHISRTPEATPFNEWLIDLLAKHAAEVAGRLTTLSPGQPTTASMFAPRHPVSGAGDDLRNRLDLHLAGVAFVPTRQGPARRPADTALLTPSLRDDEATSRLLNLPSDPPLGLLSPQDPDRAWLENLGARTTTDAECLSWLRQAPADQLDAFYSSLLAWADGSLRRSAFESALSDARCVHTTAGDWIAPGDGVYFPREREGVDLPPDLPVALADLPPIPRLDQLLEAAGVKRFRWREILLDQVLPWLTGPDTDSDLRRRAHTVLRAYFRTDPRGDQDIVARLGDVLLPASTSSDDVPVLTPAARVYFSHHWTRNKDLEVLYGPFATAEFLAHPPPASDDEDRRDEKDYLQWLGVSDRPRLDSAIADSRDRYRWSNLERHPHARAQGPAWRSWLRSEEVQAARDCGQRQTESQQIRVSHLLDRLPELIADADPQRLTVLARRLGDDWAHYSPALDAEIVCQNTTHRGATTRIVTSLLGHLLETSDWLPADLDGETLLAAPSDVWRSTPDLSRAVRSQLPLLPTALDSRASVATWTALGVVDAARPTAKDLATLLGRLADGFAAESNVEQPRPELLDTARWAMRQLNDALTRGGALDETGIPLLARLGESYLFTTTPYVCQDPLLADTWGNTIPILHADRDLRALTGWLGLRSLEEAVTVEPRPVDPQPDRAESLRARLRHAAPYLAAAALDNAPASRATLTRWLPRLEVIACRDLVLSYTLENETRERPEATTFVVERVVSTGRTRQRVGTVYLEVADDDDPNWFSLGPQLATYLEVPSQRDAFALLLGSDEATRLNYLRSRGITEEALELAAFELDMAIDEPDLPPLPEASELATAGSAIGLASDIDVAVATAHDEVPYVPFNASPEMPVPAAHELPPLASAAITLEEGPDLTVTAPNQRPATPSTGAAPGVDWDRIAASSRQTGLRGEQWVYQQERLRVAALGFDPDTAVLWQSHLDETSNYDIRSLDDDGHPLYIEVKATDGLDLHVPVEISSGELAMALSYRDRYAIYRVLDATSASPRIVRFRDPVGRILTGHGAIKVSGARVYLAPREGGDNTRPDPRSGSNSPGN
ncbi:MAG: DUF3883 domain-containing protein, partial [Nocardioidaceae bacterium]